MNRRELDSPGGLPVHTMGSGPRRRAWTRRLADDAGVALVTVIGATFAITLLLTATVAYAVNTLPQVRDHEDWNAALAAAEAGVDDLLYRQNQNSSYWSLDHDDNAAVTGWRPVPGSSTTAEYHYRIDASEIGSTGAVDVVSTGRVGDQTRTVEVRLRRAGFLDYLYFTDFEVTDPFVYPNLSDTTKTYLDGYCSVYWPERQSREDTCGTIRFAAGDVLRGPVHSNDALMMQTQSGGPFGEPEGGPRFYGEVTTGWTGSGSPLRLWRHDSGGGQPYFRDGITSRERFAFPESNQRLEDQAHETGCVYEGPTLIRFHGSESSPRMSVASPKTDAGTAGTGCGPGNNLALPDGEAIFVEETSTSGPHPLGLPRDDDDSSYRSTAGDAFVFGEVNGQVTVGAENDIYIAHHLTYGDTSADSSDLTGLIANNNIYIYRPVESNTSSLDAVGEDLPPFKKLGSANPFNADAQFDDPQVHAAMLALNRSISVQNFNRGEDQGVLHVNGVMGQRFRGPVGVGLSGGGIRGYLKDYQYDWRLRYLSPPHFLEPERTPWERRRWAELEDPDVCGAAEDPAVDACLPA